MSLKKYNIKSKNIPIMYATTVIGGMLFFLPVIALYYEETLFSVTNVALIFAVEYFASVIFEVPTGAIADLFGRRKTIILDHFITLIALVFLFIGGSMTMFILYAVFNALAMSLASGTDSALIYDSLKEEGKEKHYKKIIGTYHALWPLGASIGSIIGGYLAAVSLNFPVLITFIPITIALIFTFFLKEPKYEKEGHKNIFKQMFHSSKFILNNGQIIILILAGFLFFGFGESMHHLSPLFFKFHEIPIIYFGYIVAASFAFSSLGHYFSHDVSEFLGDKKALIAAACLSPVFVILATFNTGITVAILFIIPSIFFGIRNPIIDNYINLEVTSSKRATVLSINNLLNSFGFVFIAPLVGYLAELYTINMAFRISAGFVVLRVFVYLLLKDKETA
ncbi:MFS transporter [Patescibacteria group bacterium]